MKTVIAGALGECVHVAGIRKLAPSGVADPLVDAVTLTRAVQTGLLDAPQLKNNPFGRGKIATSIDKRGACITVDPTTRNPISEKERIVSLIIP